MKSMPPTLDLETLYDEHAQAVYAFLLNLTRNEAARLESVPPRVGGERGTLRYRFGIPAQVADEQNFAMTP